MVGAVATHGKLDALVRGQQLEFIQHVIDTPDDMVGAIVAESKLVAGMGCN